MADTRFALPLRVGDAGRGRGVEILDASGGTVAAGLAWARDEIVRIVNAHDAMLDALRVAAAFFDGTDAPTGALCRATIAAAEGVALTQQ